LDHKPQTFEHMCELFSTIMTHP